MKTLTDCNHYINLLPFIPDVGTKGISPLALAKKCGLNKGPVSAWLNTQKRPGGMVVVDVKTHTYTLSPKGKALKKALPPPTTILAPIILGALKPAGVKGFTPSELAAKTKLPLYICSSWLRNNHAEVDKLAGGRYVVTKHPPAPPKPVPSPKHASPAKPPKISPHMRKAWPALLALLPARYKKLLPIKGSVFPLPSPVMDALDDQDLSNYILPAIDAAGTTGIKFSALSFPFYIRDALSKWLAKHRRPHGWVKQKSDGCYVTTPSGKKALPRLAKADLTTTFLSIIADSTPRGITVSQLQETTSLPYDVVERIVCVLERKGMLTKLRIFLGYILSPLGEETRQKRLGIYKEPILEPPPIAIPPLVLFTVIDEYAAIGITIPDIANLTKFSVRDVEFSLKANCIIDGQKVIHVCRQGLHVLTPQGKMVHLRKLKGEVIETDAPDF